MSSSPIDGDRTGIMSAREFDPSLETVEPEPRAEFEIRPRRWIKRVLPR